MDGWADRDWRTLQFGPIWVMSAIIGRTRFDELERKAFADSVLAAPIGVTPLPWQLMQSIDRNVDMLFAELTQDNRSIASGLSQVTALRNGSTARPADGPGRRCCASAPGSRALVVRSVAG